MLTKDKIIFQKSKAAAKLAEYAKKPYDLTQPDNLSPQRIAQYRAGACGFWAFYATQRIDDRVMAALQELAEESHALEKMEKMQSGAIMNRIEGYESDDRAVLHTAMRDLFDHPRQEKPANEAAQLAQKEHEKLKNFLKTLEKERKVTDLIVIGIGGSDLGPRALYLSLQYLKKKNRNVHYISNIDPDDIAAHMKGIDLSSSLALVVSKSGTTLETVTNEAFVRSLYEKAGLDPNRHFISVSGKGSPLDDPQRYVQCFYMWDYVGGRFSTTSMCGAVSVSFGIGYENFLEFLRGAHDMDVAARQDDIQTNLPLLLALLGIWNRNFLAIPTLALVPYSQALYRFPAHIQQVDMESNGKQIDIYGTPVQFHTGPIVWGEPGTNAQHSFYQLIHQGTDPIALELIGFSHSQLGQDYSWEGTSNQEKLISNLVAQAIALAQGRLNDNPNRAFPGNRPSTLLFGEKATPYHLGVLYSLYEHKIAFQGFMWNINSFDQEGVMLGKVLAEKVLKLMAAKNAKKKGEPYPLGEAYLRQLGLL